MPDSEEAMNSFMTKEVKQSLGESIDTEVVAEDNYDQEATKTRNTFDGEGPSYQTDKGLLFARRLLHFLVVIPLIIVFLLAIFYLLLNIMPSVLIFLRKLVFMFF